MNKLITSVNYHKQMDRNIKISYVTSFLESLLFFVPIWYAFETRYVIASVLTILYALAHAVTVILEIPTGALADLIGRKWTIVIGLLIQGSGWILISVIVAPWYLWAGYLINAIGVALVSGADVALRYDSLKELQKENIFAQVSANASFVFRIGLILSVFISGIMFNNIMNLSYLAVGLCLILAAVVSLLFVEPHIDSEKFSLQNYLEQTKKGVKELLKSRFLRWFSIYYIIFGSIGWYFLYFLSQAYATNTGFNLSERANIFAAIYLIIAAFMILLTRIKKIQQTKVLVSLPILLTLGMIPAYWMSKIGAMLVLFVVQFTVVNRWTFLDQYINDEINSSSRATALSTLNMGVSGFYIFISVIMSLFIDKHGSGFVMSSIGIVATIIFIPLTFKLLKIRSTK